jgi:hypothetical protein
MKGRDHSEDLGVDTKVDLKHIWYEVVDWIHLAEDRDKWVVLVNTVLNLRVP